MEGVASDTGPSSSAASTVITTGEATDTSSPCPSSSRSDSACCPAARLSSRASVHSRARRRRHAEQQLGSVAEGAIVALHRRRNVLAAHFNLIPRPRRTAQHGDSLSRGHAVGANRRQRQGQLVHQLVHRSIRRTVRHTSGFFRRRHRRGALR